jgi:hypothetical protein
MSAPVIVRTVTHREKNDRGQRFGHVGYIQRRSNEKWLATAASDSPAGRG